MDELYELHLSFQFCDKYMNIVASFSKKTKVHKSARKDTFHPFYR